MDVSLIRFLGRSLLEGLYFHHRWMVWNLFLAVIPLCLSLPLFRADWLMQQIGLVSHRGQFWLKLVGWQPTQFAAKQGTQSWHRSLPLLTERSPLSLGWWIGALVFLAFLPNAPYVLTDVIHMIRAIQQEPSMWVSAFVWVPIFLTFMVIGFESYVISLINLGYFL
ncbi:MAG: DUF1361 domain-containing protein, partial [Synechococcales bacterium]|nr:DUF1361 domain-containing protein [Synechococcales bacterium]